MKRSKLKVRLFFILIFILSCLLFSPRQTWAAVVLSDFSATGAGDTVLVEWRTASEVDNAGFYIQRGDSLNGQYVRQSPFITSSSQNDSGEYYFWFDESVETDRDYYYKLETLDIQGDSQVFPPVMASTSSNLETDTPAPSATNTTSLVRTPTPSFPSNSTLTGTPRLTTQAGETLTAALTLTGTGIFTKTLEPLPHIEIIFPTPSVTSSFTPTKRPTITPTPTELPEFSSIFESKKTPRSTMLVVIIGTLWLILAAFLFYLVRTLNTSLDGS